MPGIFIASGLISPDEGVYIELLGRNNWHRVSDLNPFTHKFSNGAWVRGHLGYNIWCFRSDIAVYSAISKMIVGETVTWHTRFCQRLSFQRRLGLILSSRTQWFCCGHGPSSRLPMQCYVQSYPSHTTLSGLPQPCFLDIYQTSKNWCLTLHPYSIAVWRPLRWRRARTTLMMKQTMQYEIAKPMTPPRPPSMKPAPASREKPAGRDRSAWGVSSAPIAGLFIVVAGNGSGQGGSRISPIAVLCKKFLEYVLLYCIWLGNLFTMEA